MSVCDMAAPQDAKNPDFAFAHPGYAPYPLTASDMP